MERAKMSNIDEIDGQPVHYEKGKFKVTINGVDLEATTMGSLRSKAKGTSKPTKVINWYTWIAGGYEKQVSVFEATATTPKNVYRAGQFGKERISSEHLYYYTPELEEKLASLLEKVHELRKELEDATRGARTFPGTK